MNLARTGALVTWILTAAFWRKADRFRGHPVLQAAAMNLNQPTSSPLQIEKSSRDSTLGHLHNFPIVRYHNTQDIVQ